MLAYGPTVGSWTGLAGLNQGTREWLSAWEEFRQEADEYRELDSENALADLGLAPETESSPS